MAGGDISGKTSAEIETIVSRQIDNFSQEKIAINTGKVQIYASLDDLGIFFDKMATVQAVFEQGSGSFFRKQLRYARLIFLTRNIDPVFTVDSAKFGDLLQREFTDSERFAENAKIVLAKSGEVQVVDARGGIVVDRVKLVGDLDIRLKQFSAKPIVLAYDLDFATVGTNGAGEALSTAKSLTSRTINLFYLYDSWPLPGQKLFELLSFEPEGDDQNIVNLKLGQTPIAVKTARPGGSSKRLTVKLDETKVEELTREIAKSIDQPTANATLDFDGSRVTNFKPAQNGLVLDQVKTKEILLENILAKDTGVRVSVELPVSITNAKIANLEINKLGIVELLGSGVSYFAGSIPNRVFNIGLGASLITGSIVKPGEVFSFNQLVGPVSPEQGFKQAYVIKKDRTVLDDGGGICQVSTTTFRAALNAGLPIVKRTAHAYRVSYYEQRGFKPGFDATIFSPSVDLQFKNDTSHHILVQARVDKANAKIEVDIYGTGDGRQVEISDSVVSNVKPAPEPLYQDDPSLPKGTTKQVDFKAVGANVVFNRKVYKGDKVIIEDTFRSNFRPWQAVYLVGTGP